MKLKMAPNSLFAVLLRSPWWVSLGIVGVLGVLSGALLPAEYVPLGVMGGFPFLVISIMAAWRQWHSPSPARVAQALERAAGLSWREFSVVLEAGFMREGYAVTRLDGKAADFSLTKGGRTTLVSGKRWKAARHGVEALRDLAAARDTLGADRCTYVSLGPVTEQAGQFAKSNRVDVMPASELAHLVVSASSR